MKVSTPAAFLLLSAGALLCACGGKSISDDTIQLVSYELKVDGQVIDKQENVVYNPKYFPVPGLYEKLKGKSEGSHLKFTLPPEKGYGQPKKELVAYVPYDYDKPPKPGDTATFFFPKTQQLTEGKVLKLDSKLALVDFNSKYAGKPVECDITIVKVAQRKAAAKK